MARPKGLPQEGGHHPASRFVIYDLATDRYYCGRRRHRDQFGETKAPSEDIWDTNLQLAQVFLGRSAPMGMALMRDAPHLQLVQVTLHLSLCS